ncbi:ABC transporter permease [Nonomuraea sp. NPDC050783]|uniref:ABC transporter permease n=1 Tax=Nonomuraea sp. NPDC050783 TaxID=3154634 RepID=UPI003466FD36
MVERIGPVEAVSSIGKVGEARVYRSEQIPKAATNGLNAYAARLDLPATVGAILSSGTWLNAATKRYPAAVIGASTARRLGIGTADPDTQIVVGGIRFTVIGILEPVAPATELDSGVLVGWPVAESRLGFDGHPTTLYTRSEEAKLEDVRQVLAGTANPEAPNEVDVSRPSDALAADRPGLGHNRRAHGDPAHRRHRRPPPGHPRLPAVPGRSPGHTIERWSSPFQAPKPDHS